MSGKRMRFQFRMPGKDNPETCQTLSAFLPIPDGHTLTTLGTSSASAAWTFSRSRRFSGGVQFENHVKAFLRVSAQSTAVKLESMSNFSSSRRYSEISTSGRDPRSR